MKMELLSLSLISALAACNRVSQQATVDSGETTTYSSLYFIQDFSADGGPKLEISLLQQADGKYDANLIYQYHSGSPDSTREEKKELGRGLKCQFNETDSILRGPSLDSIECSVDRRPVDGELTELKISKHEVDEAFTASLHTSFVNRETGKDEDKTEELANRLGLEKAQERATPQSSSADKILFAKNDLANDGRLVEISLVPAMQGQYSGLLTITLQGRGGVSRQEQSLGDELVCTIDKDAADKIKEIKCSQDQRPTDGILSELTIAKQSDGLFTATHRAAYVDFQTGESHDTTEVIGRQLELK